MFMYVAYLLAYLLNYLFIYLFIYLLTYLLILCSRVLLEKLTGFQVVKKFPALFGNRKFITAFTSARYLSVSWASWIQSIHLHPTSWRSISILSSHLHLGLPSGLFSSGLPTKNLYTPLLSPHTCYMSSPSAYFILRFFIKRMPSITWNGIGIHTECGITRGDRFDENMQILEWCDWGNLKIISVRRGGTAFEIWTRYISNTDLGRFCCTNVKNSLLLGPTRMAHSSSSCAMGHQLFYGKGPRRLLWAGSRGARAKMTLSGIPNCQIILKFL